MQSRDEIQRTARHEGVPATTIEKDLLLDVALDEIARTPYSAGTLYFKGGTAIRKLFIPGYRYSEDLDFTFKGSWNMAALRHWLADVAAAMGQATGQPTRSLTVTETRNVTGEEALDAHLIVSSRLSSALTQRIKFDITHFEQVLDRIQVPLSSGVLLPAYSLEEIAAEKVRSLFQRVRPRDLYDLAALASRVDATTVHRLAGRHGRHGYPWAPSSTRHWVNRLPTRSSSVTRRSQKSWSSEVATRYLMSSASQRDSVGDYRCSFLYISLRSPMCMMIARSLPSIANTARYEPDRAL